MTDLTAEQITALQAEVETLRKTNQELVAKHSKDKTTIQELQNNVTGLQAKVTETETALHDATVGAALRNFASSNTIAPGLFIEQFSKRFKLDTVDGKLTWLHTKDGSPVIGSDGKPVPFTEEAVRKFLTSGDDEQSKAFKAIIIASKASGAQSTTQLVRRSAIPAKQTIFGLR